MAYTQREGIDAILRADRLVEGRLTFSDYKRLRREKDPSAGTIAESLFESWSDAKEEAGLKRDAQMKLVNEEYFAHLDSSVAYWLGFLLGDGWVSGDKVGLEVKDRDAIEKFKDALDSGHAVGERDGKYSIQINNEQLAKYLKMYGVDGDKTSSDSLPPVTGYRNDLVRGLWEADGSLVEGPQLTIVGSGDRLKKVADICPVNAKVYDRGDGVHQFTVHGAEDVSEIRSWMYPDGVNTQPSVDRKRVQIYGRALEK